MINYYLTKTNHYSVNYDMYIVQTATTNKYTFSTNKILTPDNQIAILSSYSVTNSNLNKNAYSLMGK